MVSSPRCQIPTLWSRLSIDEITCLHKILSFRRTWPSDAYGAQTHLALSGIGGRTQGCRPNTRMHAEYAPDRQKHARQSAVIWLKKQGPERIQSFLQTTAPYCRSRPSAAIAPAVERTLGKGEVACSNHAGSTIYFSFFDFLRLNFLDRKEAVLPRYLNYQRLP